MFELIVLLVAIAAFTWWLFWRGEQTSGMRWCGVCALAFVYGLIGIPFYIAIPVAACFMFAASFAPSARA